MDPAKLHHILGIESCVSGDDLNVDFERLWFVQTFVFNQNIYLEKIHSIELFEFNSKSIHEVPRAILKLPWPSGALLKGASMLTYLEIHVYKAWGRLKFMDRCMSRS